MPRAQDLARQNCRQINSVKVRWAGAIVGRTAADEGLHEEQQRDDGEVLNRRALAGCRHSWEHFGVHMPALPSPSKEVEASEGEEYRRSRTKQHDKAKCAPQHCAASRCVADRRIIGKIIGVRVVAAGPIRDRNPRRPCEERGQLTKLRRVSDVIARKAGIALGGAEILCP
jgi:hypothetical protein